MDKKEAEFQAALLSTFKIEAEEHLKAISDGLLELERNPHEGEAKACVESIFREAHSLKGAARSVNFSSVQSLCQSMENVLAAWKQSRIAATQEFFDTLHKTLDLIGKLVKLPQGSGGEAEDLVDLLQRLDQLIMVKKEMAAAIRQERKEGISPHNEPEPVKETAPLRQVKEPSAVTSGEMEQEAVRKAQAEEAFVKNHNGATIRVSLEKLDSLFQQVEEMLMVKLTFKQQLGNLKNVDQAFRAWEKKWGKAQHGIFSLRKSAEDSVFVKDHQHSSLAGTIEYIDWTHDFISSLKDNLNALIKETSQYQQVATSSVDSLLDEARKMLMQPISTVLDSFPRMIRDISLSQGKTVRFETAGADIEVDRRILEEMKDPLIHLIRNSIDHGIELPAVRESAGKKASGTIFVRATETGGNSMELVITDDGQGIDIAKVKESAIRQGVLTEEEAVTLIDQECLKLIFGSGVSTAPIITDLSGRGVGLGIVADKVDKLGGQLFVETKKNEGTTFRIVLPLTLATFRGVHFKLGEASFIVPSHNVKQVIRINPKDLKTVENRQIISYEGKAIAVISLAALLGLETKRSSTGHRMLNAIIVKAMDKMIAFTVDEIVSEQDVLVKGLGKNLKRVRNVMAVSLTDSGQVIPILNPQDLIKSSTSATHEIGVEAKDQRESARTILIAEDSITSRMLLKNILESAGYVVKVAVDGLEALSAFKIQDVDLIISDVEMPRMDGFTLTTKVRSLEKGRQIPIILCTSLDSPKDREHGMEVGASAYLEKSQFTQGNLLDIIRNLI
ncbi:hybrid sensor histidine kinase/response regulator [Estrella lausannensis]|uniref:histidine kinase n=1 Tax=Estrella lausannensis TaxID=483423 RepID=A0A0H5DRH2_9BACT|nr:response regulator [Estrella lausannensis]CRX39296.1 chemotaxis protein histidine kinase-like protein [Estrella lausannensis]